jgi:hypothetical protein
MTTFNEREQAYEAKFAHDAEFRFLVEARRDKLLAHWAAAKAGIGGAAEDELVSSTLAIPNGPDHDAALLSHIEAALNGCGMVVSAPQLAEAFRHCDAEALRQLTEHPPAQSDIV